MFSVSRPIDVVVLNDCVTETNVMATLTAWAELRGVPYEGVPVGTIKRHAAGNGNADKSAMVAAVRARGFSPADDNEADAIALLLWAIETNGGVA